MNISMMLISDFAEYLDVEVFWDPDISRKIYAEMSEIYCIQKCPK